MNNQLSYDQMSPDQHLVKHDFPSPFVNIVLSNLSDVMITEEFYPQLFCSNNKYWRDVVILSSIIGTSNTTAGDKVTLDLAYSLLSWANYFSDDLSGATKFRKQYGLVMDGELCHSERQLFIIEVLSEYTNLWTNYDAYDDEMKEVIIRQIGTWNYTYRSEVAALEGKNGCNYQWIYEQLYDQFERNVPTTIFDTYAAQLFELSALVIKLTSAHLTDAITTLLNSIDNATESSAMSYYDFERTYVGITTTVRELVREMLEDKLVTDAGIILIALLPTPNHELPYVDDAFQVELVLGPIEYYCVDICTGLRQEDLFTHSHLEYDNLYESFVNMRQSYLRVPKEYHAFENMIKVLVEYRDRLCDFDHHAFTLDLTNILSRNTPSPQQVDLLRTLISDKQSMIGACERWQKLVLKHPIVTHYGGEGIDLYRNDLPFGSTTWLPMAKEGEDVEFGDVLSMNMLNRKRITIGRRTALEEDSSTTYHLYKYEFSGRTHASRRNDTVQFKLLTIGIAVNAIRAQQFMFGTIDGKDHVIYQDDDEMRCERNTFDEIGYMRARAYLLTIPPAGDAIPNLVIDRKFVSLEEDINSLAALFRSPEDVVDLVYSIGERMAVEEQSGPVSRIPTLLSQGLMNNSLGPFHVCVIGFMPVYYQDACDELSKELYSLDGRRMYFNKARIVEGDHTNFVCPGCNALWNCKIGMLLCSSIHTLCNNARHIRQRQSQKTYYKNRRREMNRY